MNIIEILNNHNILINSKLHSKSLRLITEEIKQLLTDSTSFLDSRASLRDRILSLQFNLHYQPTCQTCNTPVFPKLRNTKLVLPLYCCKQCVNNFNTRDKRNATIKEKYGVDHPLHVQSFFDKRTQTVRERYNVDVVTKSPIIRERIKQTNLEEYGVENPQQNEAIKQKTKQTNLKRYGSECSLLNEHIQKKTKQTNLSKFGTEHPMQNPDVFAQTKASMRDSHGVDFFNQKHIAPESLTLLNDKAFLEHQHFVLQLNQSQIAEQLSVGKSVVSRYFKKHGIVTKHFFRSVGEQQLASFIKTLGYPIECNNRSIIYPLEVDIYVPELKLALEYNGTYWHSEQRGRGESYHNNKTLECLNVGVVLLHVSEDDWLNNQQLVKQVIETTVQQLTLYPLL